MLEKSLFLFLWAFVPSAVLVCGAALLLSPTATGRGLPPVSTHAKAASNPSIAQAEKDRPSLERILAFDVIHDATLTSVTTSPLAGAQSVEADSELESLEQAEPTTEPVVLASRPSETIPRMHAASSLNPATRGSSPKPTRSTAKAPTRPAIAGAYSAKVWAALARHKPTAVARGSTTVMFEIDASGGLGHARVSSSSGKVSLDQLALQTVRSAAPFPSPPHGAASYTIRIDFQ